MPTPRDIETAQTPKWPFPEEHTLVGRSEQFVKMARESFAHHVATLTREVVGDSGRGFLEVELTPEERAARFRVLREADDPVGWAALLEKVADSPRERARVLRQLREREAEYRGGP